MCVFCNKKKKHTLQMNGGLGRGREEEEEGEGEGHVGKKEGEKRRKEEE